MTPVDTDILIVGAGPVGLLSAYLASQCGLKTIIVDKSDGPTEVGRADALNARTLQLLEIAGLFDELFPQGKPCKTSSVWANGQFVSRQSSWWDALEGCFHKHFLMIGQSYVEEAIDKRLNMLGRGVRRKTEVANVSILDDTCVTTLCDGSVIRSRFVIGADGPRSLVRKLFGIGFEITKPEITWAVVDGVIDTDFPKVPEIIVFQTDTSDVAWIPRERNVDRFYVRIDKQSYSFEEIMDRIQRAISPHQLKFNSIEWTSSFSVKESVADRFSVRSKVFLVGDACHIHSVNGGQGLNTGIGDAFNLIWRLNMVINHGAKIETLAEYEKERKPVALSVIDSSGELVRSTKYSQPGTHANEYVRIVEQRAGNITGMGIRYGKSGLAGSRLYDFEVMRDGEKKRIYSLLDYSKYTLLVFTQNPVDLPAHQFLNIVTISKGQGVTMYESNQSDYEAIGILVRPDGYIDRVLPPEALTSNFTVCGV
jgi:2-polyprenyl-6-methoxyphenol hydroxylase-like FAD-dependent oxidoreductase